MENKKSKANGKNIKEFTSDVAKWNSCPGYLLRMLVYRAP